MPNYLKRGQVYIEHDSHTYLDLSHHDAGLPPPILTAPDGGHWRLIVDNMGTLSTKFVAVDPAGAGASGTGYLSESGSRLISSTSYCFKGDPITPEVSLTITALKTEASIVAGAIYQGLVVVGDTVVERILAKSATVTGAATGYGLLTIPMNITVAAGESIVVLTGRIDAGNGHVYPVDAYDGTRSGFSWQGIPAGDVGYSCSRIVEANPQVGTVINRGKGYNSAPFNVHIDWTRV